MSQPRKTENECRTCGHAFTGLIVLQPDGNWRHVIPGQRELKCPNCGGDYWRWLNYERDFK